MAHSVSSNLVFYPVLTSELVTFSTTLLRQFFTRLQNPYPLTMPCNATFKLEKRSFKVGLLLENLFRKVLPMTVAKEILVAGFPAYKICYNSFRGYYKEKMVILQAKGTSNCKK